MKTLTTTQKHIAHSLHTSDDQGTVTGLSVCENGKCRVTLKTDNGFAYTLYIGRRGKVYENEFEWE